MTNTDQLRNKFRRMAARANSDPIYALAMHHELMSIVEQHTATAVRAARIDEIQNIAGWVYFAEDDSSMAIKKKCKERLDVLNREEK